MTETGRRVLKLLLAQDSPTQESLAAELKVSRGAVARAVGDLAKAGLVEIRRDGQKQRPRLRVLAALENCEIAIRSLREAVVS